MRRGFALSKNGPQAKGLAELNHHMRDERKELRDGVGGGGQGLSQEEESKINNESSENIRRLPSTEAAAEVQVVLQRKQQPPPPQGPLVQWERFLPLRSLKVLLVENDGATRHLVSALLRNCSYEVVAVANGLEGWRVVEDQTNRIDLVLTEVVMPCLTGVRLLSLIKSHKTCKNIPVIMMSSNDSMRIVFKCLSEGAVDFLVKPIRKNELKNLWQHVWRKCNSSSGSASESGIRTQKSTKSKTVEGSENNSGSNEEEYGSIGLNAKDGSDNGSGTQISWSKRVVEVDTPQAMSPCADPPDSTCAQVVHSKPEAFSNNLVPRAECRKDDDELDSCYMMGKDLEIGVPINSEIQLEDPTKNKDNFFDLNSKIDGKRVDSDEVADVENEKTVVNLLGGATNNNYYNTQTKLRCVANEVTNEVSNTIKDKAVVFDAKELPSLELSLKRQRYVESTGQERNVLRHSDLSAFSRYNTSSNTNQTQTGNVGSCSPLDNSSEPAKTESLLNLQPNSMPNQRSNGSSNDDMGSTTNNVVTKPEAFSDKPTPKSVVNIHPSSAFQPVQQAHVSTLQPEKGYAETSSGQVQHHCHNCYHCHLHNMQQEQQQQQQQQQQQVNSHDDLSLRKKQGSASQCGPSNVMNGSIEGNAANYGLNGSTSGSNKGENSGGGTMGDGMQMGSDNGGGAAAAAKYGGDDGSGSGSGSGSRSGVDQNRWAQREAALKKFRQKRKDRCFEKKVRYQSRKKLAEQKPRVRGQFVRKTVDENKKKDCDS